VVRAYVPQDRRSADRVARIQAGVQLMGLIKPLSPLEVRTVSLWEWEEAWKAHFRPLRIGARLVVVPTWHEHEAEEGDIVLTLDPGLAFGTGHHPTTRMCLEQLERRIEPGMRILDLGTGSGLLAQAALLLGAEWALALDTAADAIRSSRRNLKAAGLSRRVRIARGTLPHPQAEGLDLTVANISAKVLVELAGEIAATLRMGGTLIASGVLDERGDEVREAMLAAGFEELETQQTEDWLALAFRRTR
ncbi:MAG: 50S ribosomal protein L11 methyltransferase, partial [Chloroflexota bacterium]|nr:50S ribosomal protein L11 methyltransferase [Chloroflexota bacterium]